MKRTLLPLCLAAAVALLPLSLLAQSPGDALHAPDGNSYEQIVNIFISPLTNSPFTATVSASCSATGAPLETPVPQRNQKDTRG